MARKAPDPHRSDRRTVRVILTLVVAGWLVALVLMTFAALYWDKG